MAKHRQRSLFADPGAAVAGNVRLHAQVVFNRPLRTSFTYAVPADLESQVIAGKRVIAPFGAGNRATTGFCVALTTDPPPSSDVKPIARVLDSRPLLSPLMLDLTSWIADEYYCGWGQVLEAVLPRGVKSEKGTRWGIFLVPVEESKRPNATLTPKQTRALSVLIERGRPTLLKELGQLARCGPEVLKALIAKGVVSVVRQRLMTHAPRVTPVEWDTPRALNDDQRAALLRIVGTLDDPRPATFLLHGVTGSGKTEVYLQAITQVVSRGGEAIVLVPEISLTPQTIERFRQRFDRVAVLHSHLSDAERHWHWQRIAAGEIHVVVGARSAIFAPCQRLGLIVIDEEHETTFKQETTPRYHAREVAVQRGKLENVPVVLGSATPSLESWHRALLGEYQLLSLPHRVAQLRLPAVKVVDMTEEYREHCGKRALSRPLVQAMEQTLATDGQVLLLLNRRGFATTLMCPRCGHVHKCVHCDIAVTFHKQIDRLVCHGCDAEFPIPGLCEQCRQPTIRFAGIGTERLEEEIHARFPEVDCARMDSDTMRSAAHYERVLGDFRAGRVKILLGTQMIAKGLDFPNVHLVGVISADTARNLPDFRAAERTFQLVAQVAGRTGRGEVAGLVLVQTFNPGDPAIQAAIRHDFRQFADRELEARRELAYPPFERLVRVIVRSETESLAKDAARAMAERFRTALRDTEAARVLGPAPAPVAKVRDQYRFHLQIHVHGRALPLLDAVLMDLQFPSAIEFMVDIDPVNLL